jgi:hypothetical protein
VVGKHPHGVASEADQVAVPQAADLVALDDALKTVAALTSSGCRSGPCGETGAWPGRGFTGNWAVESRARSDIQDLYHAVLELPLIVGAW